MTEWVRADEKTGWLRVEADVKVCPKCWAPLVILGNGYDWDGRESHVCVREVR